MIQLLTANEVTKRALHWSSHRAQPQPYLFADKIVGLCFISIALNYKYNNNSLEILAANFCETEKCNEPQAC